MVKIGKFFLIWIKFSNLQVLKKFWKNFFKQVSMVLKTVEYPKTDIPLKITLIDIEF